MVPLLREFDAELITAFQLSRYFYLIESKESAHLIYSVLAPDLKMPVSFACCYGVRQLEQRRYHIMPYLKP